MFSSPSVSRWERGKQNNETVGFGMELPSEDEYLKIKELLYRDLPNCLYKKNTDNQNYYKIDSHLKELNLPKGPEAYERRILFGSQFRYSFGTPADIATGLSGLKNAIDAYAKEGELISNYKDTDSAKSHKLVQLNFNPMTRVFRHQIVSIPVFHLAVQKVEEVQNSEMRNLLLQVRNQDYTLYGHMLEVCTVTQLRSGTKFSYRPLGQEDGNLTNMFEPCKEDFFSCVSHPPIQIWYEDVDHTSVLGQTKINENILYFPTDKTCATVDAVLLEKKSRQIIVNFIQITVRNSHGVSPAAFFAMFMLVKLVKFHNRDCNNNVLVNFYFVVPKDKYTDFNSPEADYLRYLFKNINIFVMKFDEEYLYDESQINIVTSSISSPSVNGNGTNKQKKKGKTTKNVIREGEQKNEEENLTHKVLDPEATPSSSSALYAFRNDVDELEKQNISLPLNRNPPVNQPRLLISIAKFDNIDITLNFNNNIKCVINNSVVSVIDMLNLENDNKKSDLSEDFDCTEIFNKFEYPESISVFSKDKKEKTGNYSLRYKQNLVLKGGSKEITSTYNLVLMRTYFTQIDESFHAYLKICTLFYKKSVESQNNKQRNKDELILNLLPQIKEKIKDNSNVFEIEFFGPFEEEEICILLGCLNLRLLNIDPEVIDKNSKKMKYKVKSYPGTFEKQINFLTRIKQTLEILGINIYLLKK
jgi:hypothetical protein